MTTPTRVETRLHMGETMETNTLEPWGTFWFSEGHFLYALPQPRLEITHVPHQKLHSASKGLV